MGGSTVCLIWKRPPSRFALHVQARTHHCSQVAREPPLIGLGVWSRAGVHARAYV